MVVVDTATNTLLKALASHNLETFCSTLQTLFARIPYTLRINKESYYHSIFQFLVNLLILEAQSEVITNIGRIDTVVQIDKYIYIFELKMNKSPEEGLEQIINKKYYEAYTLYNKQIVLVGLVFNTIDENFTISYTSQDL
jgi:hypothetical protein